MINLYMNSEDCWYEIVATIYENEGECEKPNQACRDGSIYPKDRGGERGHRML